MKIGLKISVSLFFFYLLLDFHLAVCQYSFTRYTPSDGLLSYQTNTVTQDEEGYIWIGTTDGLQRFDGTEYKSFQMANSALPSNPVWELLLDKKNRLWVLLADGKVGLFDTKKFIFQEIHTHFKKAISPNTYLKHLIADDFGHIFYLMGNSEVIPYDEKTKSFSYQHNFLPFDSKWDIVDFIHQPKTQKYWVSLSSGGLAVFNNKTKKLSYPGHNVENEVLIERLDKRVVYRSLLFDKNNRFWYVQLGKVASINCYNFQALKWVIKNGNFFSKLPSHHEIYGFKELNDGSIWLKGQLVFAHFQEDSKKFELVKNGFFNERSIAYDKVRCVFEDREQNIWVSTSNNGVFRFNPSNEFFKNISHYCPLTNKNGQGRVHSFIKTKWNTILTGTLSDGIFQYDLNLKSIPLDIKGLNKNDNIWNMCASVDSNTIWLSSDGGFYALNQKLKTAKFYYFDVLKNEKIKQIVEDKRGNLWLGTENKGIFNISITDLALHPQNSIKPFKNIPEVSINKLTISTNGNIWVATPENGAFLFDPISQKVIKHLTHSEADGKLLPERGVSTILDYNDSLTVILTATRIVCYNWKTNKTLTVGKPGTISGFNTALEKDKKGFLWLSSTNGLYRVNIFKRVFTMFNRNDGLDNENFTQSSSLVLPDGRLLFGTTNHFIAIYIQEIFKNKLLIKAKITEFRAMNKSLSIDSLMKLKTIELDHNNNSLLINFSTLLYSVSPVIKYKLEGIDTDWKMSNNEAIYSYLPPENYAFYLRTLDEDGNVIADGKYLTIRVNSPFYETWWFYGIFIIIGSSLFFGFDQARKKRKAFVEQMRIDIANNLHQEVNTALNNINILSEMAKIKANKDPEKSKEFIEQIHSKSNEMIVAMDDMLWSIEPENDSMDKTLQRIKEFLFAQNAEYNLDTKVFVDERVLNLNLNMQLRHEAFILFKESMIQIAKSQAKDIKINIGIEKNNLLFNIEFSIQVFNKQPIMNLLHNININKRMDVIKAKNDFEILKNHANYTLKIPVNER